MLKPTAAGVGAITIRAIARDRILLVHARNFTNFYVQTLSGNNCSWSFLSFSILLRFYPLESSSYIPSSGTMALQNASADEVAQLLQDNGIHDSTVECFRGKLAHAKCTGCRVTHV